MSQFVDGTTYIVVSCGAEGCGLTFGMPEHFYDSTIEKGWGWSCPQGHRRVWLDKTTEQKLREAKARETHLQEQLGAAVQDAERLRVAIVKDRQRFANGVCPCCDRSFQNVRRHMTTQHPDYDITKVDQPPSRRFKCACGNSFDSLRGLRTHQGRLRGEGWDRPNAPAWRSHLTRV
jgi:hypothetical protein